MSIPLLTILISLIALFVNNYITSRNNKLQIEANVITTSRVKWIQDVRDALVSLNKANSQFRLESSKIIFIDNNNATYIERENSFNQSYLNTQSAIQQLRNYFPIKVDELSKYKKYNHKLKNSDKAIKFELLNEHLYFSHMNLHYLLDMYEIELDNLHLLYANKDIDSLQEKYKFDYNSEQKAEYIAIKIISDWVNSYLKNEWDEAKIIKLKKSTLDRLKNLFSK